MFSRAPLVMSMGGAGEGGGSTGIDADAKDKRPRAASMPEQVIRGAP